MSFLDFRASLGIVAVTAIVMLSAATSSAMDHGDDHAMSPAHDTDTLVVLPNDEETLRALEQKHRKIVRQAARECAPGLAAASASDRDPCVISNVERSVEASDDPYLIAFNAALPKSVRYDEDRRENVWMIGQDDEAPDAVIVE